jgi:DNA (cytosine-5)-methyltransferase 1
VRPRLLDLFCGAGGAAMGYHRAGFDVVGVDIRPQPNYPFEFHQADALLFIEALLGPAWGGWELGEFDTTHASPPCQRWATFNRDDHKERHPDLITPLRPLLEATGLPYVIENVPRAPLRRDLILCGTTLGLEANGKELRRHRVFESNVLMPLVSPCHHRLPPIWAAGHSPNTDYRRMYGDCSTEERRQAMGTPWMTREELREAIPPAYTELIGHQLMQHLRVAA